MSDTLVAVTVIGRDRPGIVAAVTKVLFEHDCNLEDASSAILRGHFSMMFVVRVPPGYELERLRSELGAVGRQLGLVVTAEPVQETPSHPPSPSHVVSVYGSDRPGIVYRVAEALAARDVNITELSSRVLGSGDESVYALMLEVAAGDADVAAALEGLKSELGVEVTVRRIEADIL